MQSATILKTCVIGTVLVSVVFFASYATNQWQRANAVNQASLLIVLDDALGLSRLIDKYPHLLDAKFRPPSHTGEQSWGIVCLASHHLAPNCLNVLADRGANFTEYTHDYGIPPAMLAARSSDRASDISVIIQCLNILFSNGAGVDAVWKNACLTVHMEELLRDQPRWRIVQFLLDAGSDVNFFPCLQAESAKSIFCRSFGNDPGYNNFSDQYYCD
jgi:ankyrin repeat protein